MKDGERLRAIVAGGRFERIRRPRSCKAVWSAEIDCASAICRLRVSSSERTSGAAWFSLSPPTRMHWRMPSMAERTGSRSGSPSASSCKDCSSSMRAFCSDQIIVYSLGVCHSASSSIL
eukprot:scaffold243365_cov33-Tisochrysis_lutea.AAC.3